MQLKITREIGDKAGEGRAIGNLGTCYSYLGQCQEAIEHHEMHLKITREIENKAAEGCAIGKLGNYCHSIG